jgi:hypothetical protein
MQASQVTVNKRTILLILMRIMRLVNKVETFSNHCHHLIKDGIHVDTLGHVYHSYSCSQKRRHWLLWLFFSTLYIIVVNSVVLLNWSNMFGWELVKNRWSSLKKLALYLIMPHVRWFKVTSWTPWNCSKDHKTWTTWRTSYSRTISREVFILFQIARQKKHNKIWQMQKN